MSNDTALEANAQRKLRKEDWPGLGPKLPLVTILLEYSNPHPSSQPLLSQREGDG